VPANNQHQLHITYEGRVFMSFPNYDIALSGTPSLPGQTTIVSGQTGQNIDSEARVIFRNNHGMYWDGRNLFLHPAFRYDLVTRNYYAQQYVDQPQDEWPPVPELQPSIEVPHVTPAPTPQVAIPGRTPVPLPDLPPVPIPEKQKSDVKATKSFFSAPATESQSTIKTTKTTSRSGPQVYRADSGGMLRRTYNDPCYGRSVTSCWNVGPMYVKRPKVDPSWRMVEPRFK
jgi:hypothetical protein